MGYGAKIIESADVPRGRDGIICRGTAPRDVNKSIHHSSPDKPQKFARLKMYSVSREITA